MAVTDEQAMSGQLVQEFPWIELAGRTEDGQMFRNQFVRVDDTKAIARLRERFNNTDVYRSVCQLAEPDRKARYICPVFFDMDAPDLEEARRNTLMACDLMMDRWDVSMSSLDIFFSGAKGFHLLIPLEVFNGFSSSHLMRLCRSLARRLMKEGVQHIDLGVYQPARLLRLVNSINSKTGLCKVPLEYKELRDLG